MPDWLTYLSEGLKNRSQLVARDDFTASMSRQLSKNADIFRGVICTAHVDTVLDEAD